MRTNKGGRFNARITTSKNGEWALVIDQMQDATASEAMELKKLIEAAPQIMAAAKELLAVEYGTEDTGERNRLIAAIVAAEK